jgi:peptidoglycan lytic transglycosylase
LAVAAGAMAIPGLAFADSGGGDTGGAGTGGAGTGPGIPGSSQTPIPSPPVTAGNGLVTASSDGITITSAASAFVRGGVSVTGSVPASDAGDVVEIDQLSSANGGAWVPVADAGAQSGGSFAATWHPSRAGQLTIRAVINGTQASSAAAAPTLSVTVYRRSVATLYGPGFWGHRTACGEILRRRTIGVANRTLPCGTPVQIYYQGRVITVPVIDRGPYVHGANWDLTMATGRAIGALTTVVIGAAAVPPTTATSASTPSTAAPSAQ